MFEKFFQKIKESAVISKDASHRISSDKLFYFYNTSDVLLRLICGAIEEIKSFKDENEIAFEPAANEIIGYCTIWRDYVEDYRMATECFGDADEAFSGVRASYFEARDHLNEKNVAKLVDDALKYCNSSMSKLESFCAPYMNSINDSEKIYSDNARDLQTILSYKEEFAEFSFVGETDFRRAFKIIATLADSYSKYEHNAYVAFFLVRYAWNHQKRTEYLAKSETIVEKACGFYLTQKYPNSYLDNRYSYPNAVENAIKQLCNLSVEPDEKPLSFNELSDIVIDKPGITEKYLIRGLLRTPNLYIHLKRAEITEIDESQTEIGFLQETLDVATKRIKASKMPMIIGINSPKNSGKLLFSKLLAKNLRCNIELASTPIEFLQIFKKKKMSDILCFYVDKTMPEERMANIYRALSDINMQRHCILFFNSDDKKIVPDHFTIYHLYEYIRGLCDYYIELPVADNKSKRALAKKLNFGNEVIDEMLFYRKASIGEIKRFYDRYDFSTLSDEEIKELWRKWLADKGISVEKGSGKDDHNAILKYDFSYINADYDIVALTDAILKDSSPSAKILLDGVSGAGKTEYVKRLALALGKPIVEIKQSEIGSCKAHVAAKTIGNKFAEAKKTGAIVLIDEADSFLYDKSKLANVGWMLEEVNEMMTSIENYDGILFATTNVQHSLEPAVFRRFDLKISFSPLTSEQFVKVFKSVCTNLNLTVSHELEKEISNVSRCTLGIFNAVTRSARFVPIASAESLYEKLKNEMNLLHGNQRPASPVVG